MTTTSDLEPPSRLRRVRHSIASLGWRRAVHETVTGRRPYEPAEDLTFDARHGTDTAGSVAPDQLGIADQVTRSNAILYLPSPLRVTNWMLDHVGVDPSERTFVDLGCGKGRGLIVAILCGFTHVTGVDYSPALCAVAESNLLIVRRRTKREFTSSVYAMDAADYAFASHDTVVYLFNPFDAVVLAAVLARLARSLEKHPRTVWIVYHNPVWRAVIEHAGEFTSVRDYSSGGGVFAVYRSR